MDKEESIMSNKIFLFVYLLKMFVISLIVHSYQTKLDITNIKNLPLTKSREYSKTNNDSEYRTDLNIIITKKRYFFSKHATSIICMSKS